MDTVEANIKLGFKADLRDYGIGAQILRDLGVRKMGLLTNNPKKIVGLEGYGIEVVARFPIEIEANAENKRLSPVQTGSNGASDRSDGLTLHLAFLIYDLLIYLNR